MIIGFVTGFIVALVLSTLIAKRVVKYAIDKGWYSSAIFVEKENTWKVSGNYLRNATRILKAIRNESTEKVKYVA